MKPALLVIDCQNDFIEDSSAYSCEMLNDRLISRIRKLIKFCRKKGIPVVYTQHSIKADKSNAEHGEPANVKACIVDTDGWEIIEALKPKENEKVVRKDKYDAFVGTELDDVLKKLGVSTLLICGVYTNNCVRATSEGAHYRNYDLVLISDCCGANSFVEGVSAKKANKFTLEELKGRVYNVELINYKGLDSFLSSK